MPCLTIRASFFHYPEIQQVAMTFSRSTGYLLENEHAVLLTMPASHTSSHTCIRVLVIVSLDRHECTCNTAVRGITRGKVEVEAARRTARAKKYLTSATKYAYSDTAIGIINKQEFKQLHYSIGNSRKISTKFFEISEIFKVCILHLLFDTL